MRDQEIFWQNRNRKNSRRHSQLVGSWLCRALVSEKDAGGRAAPMVCAAFRNGRGELDILLRARTENGRTLVRGYAGRFHIRRKVTPTVLLPLDIGKVLAAGFTAARRDRCQGTRKIDAGFTGSAVQNFSARDGDFSRFGQARRLSFATLTRVLSAQT